MSYDEKPEYGQEADYIDESEHSDEPEYIELKDHYVELQYAADVLEVRKIVSKAGFGSLIFGLLAFVQGLAFMQVNDLNAILALNGAVLIAVGLYSRITKRPIAVKYDGIALITLGLWNVFVVILNASHAGVTPNTVSGTFYAMFQFSWGGKSLKNYKKYIAVMDNEPHQNFTEWVKEVIKGFKRARFKRNEKAISLTEKTFLKASTWKGILMDDGAVFSKLGNSAFERDKAEKVKIVPMEHVELKINKMKKRSGNVTLLLFNDEVVTGKISKKHADRFEAWKTVMPDSSSV